MIKIYVVLFLMCSCTSIKKDLTHREFIARLNLGQVNGTGNLITYNNKTFFFDKSTCMLA
jgi:hypothetical protein